MALQAIYEKLDAIPEQFRELYAERNGKFELVGVEGIKTQGDVDRLTEAARRERELHKETKQKLQAWGAFGKTPEELQDLLDRVPELEAAAQGKGVDEKKLEALVEARANRMAAPIQRKLDEATTLLKTFQEQNQALLGEKMTRSVHDEVRAAATKLKVIPEALPDVLMLAERMFEVGEDGKVTTRDQVGVTPGVGAEVWLTDMQKNRPHWWPPSQGTGASGSGGGGGSFFKNPFSNEHWNLTEQGKVFRESPERAQQMMKAAGASKLGEKPAAKK